MERAVSYIQSYKRKVITVENILNKRNLPAFMSEDEMLEILLREEYGYMPPAPESVKFEIYEKGVRSHLYPHPDSPHGIPAPPNIHRNVIWHDAQFLW